MFGLSPTARAAGRTERGGGGDARPRYPVAGRGRDRAASRRDRRMAADPERAERQAGPALLPEPRGPCRPEDRRRGLAVRCEPPHVRLLGERRRPSRQWLCRNRSLDRIHRAPYAEMGSLVAAARRPIVDPAIAARRRAPSGPLQGPCARAPPPGL